MAKDFESDMNINSTGAVKLPLGTTAERPTPVAGMLRANSTTGKTEVYTGTEWLALSTVPPPPSKKAIFG